MGMTLSMFVLGSSVFSCYAVSSSISVDVNASRVYGQFDYGEPGHQLTVTVFYEEKDAKGNLRYDNISETRNGIHTSVGVGRSSTSEFQYVWGYSVGLIDRAVKAITPKTYV